MKNIHHKSESEILRQKAEDLLKKKSSGSGSPISETDMLKLIYELEVHQIELEMQNVELIDAKKQADIATEKYTELYDFAPSGYFTLSKEGKILWLNICASQMLGKERAHLISRPFGFFVSNNAKSTFNLFLANLFDSKVKAECEITLSADANSLMDVHLTAIYSGEKDQCHLTVVDITERKQMENELKLSEARLAAAQAVAKVGCWETDLATLNVIWSDETFRIFEIVPDGFQTTHPNFLEYVHPDDRAKVDASFTASIGTNFVHAIEHRIVTPSGLIKNVEERWQILYDDMHQPSKALGTCQDITVRKQAEEAFTKSLNYNKALLDAIPDLMFRLNSKGVFLDYKAAKENLAHQEQSIVGKNNRDISSPEFADMVEEKIKQTILTGQIQIFEYQLSLPSAGIREFEARMAPSGSDEVIAIVRDITDRKKAEAEIILKNEQLTQANIEKDKFFSIIAHDLRSPFNAFLGLTRLLVEELDTFSLKELQQIALSMRNSAANLFGLLENLLEWSRLRRGVTDFKPETFLLKSFGAESLSSVLEPITKKGIEIRYEIPENIEVYADRYMLGSTLRNLVSNATKFTHTGGVITFTAKSKSDNSVEISINDTGIGMNRKMIENLFRLDEQTNRKGTEGESSIGLGLIICKEFIEKHGGKLWVESDEGKGSTFSLSLPPPN
ncbi:MAG: ATP-binding protein [Bacteroidota bacterium]